MATALNFSQRQSLVLEMIRPFNMSFKLNACIPLTGAISSALQKMGLKLLIRDESTSNIAERISLIQSYDTLLAADIVRKFISSTFVISAIALKIISSSLGCVFVATFCITALECAYNLYNNEKIIEDLQAFGFSTRQLF